MHGADDPTTFTPSPSSSPTNGPTAPRDDDRTAFSPPPAPSSRGSFAPAPPVDHDRTAYTPPPVVGPHDVTAVGEHVAQSAASDTFDEGALEAAPGSFIGGYQVERTLGRGGMGIVYLARDPRLGRRVALKVLPVTAGTSAQAVQRFEREARTIAALDHPAIRPIHGWGRDDQARVFWLAMGFVDGRPYDDVVKEVGLGHESARRAARVVADAARALAFAHRKGVIHRDVKPSNLMLETGEGLKVHVVDFGLARLEGTPELTVEGQVMGTLRFMPPEQALGAEASALSDVYSLGATLFWALTGEGPYDVQRIENLQLRLARGDAPRRPTSLRRDVAPELEAITLRALELEPTDRYAGADALADDLERWLAGEPVLARPPSRWRELRRAARRQALLLAPLALVLLALGIVAGGRAWRRAEADRRLAALQAPVTDDAGVSALLEARAALRREDLAQASDAAAASVEATLRRIDDDLLRARLSAARDAVDAAVARWAARPAAPDEPPAPIAAEAPTAVAEAARAAAEAARPLVGLDDLPAHVTAEAAALARLADDVVALASGKTVTRTAPAGALLEGLDGQPRSVLVGSAAEVPAWGVVRVIGPGERRAARFFDPIDALEAFPAPSPHPAARYADMVLVEAPGRRPFFIDAHEVPAARFARFLDDPGGHADAARWTPARSETLARALAGARDDAPAGALPVTGVSLHEARAFAASRGRRLPTALEWRIAAGLPPWRAPPAPRAGRAEAARPVTAEAPFDTSPCGVRDMAGNVAEWVEGPALIMGGSYADVGLSLQPWPRVGAVDHDPAVGFRCAADLAGGAR